MISSTGFRAPTSGPEHTRRSARFTKFAAWTAVAVLGAATTLRAAQTAPAGGHRRGGMSAFLSSYLNLTPAQQTQATAIFQESRQSAQPIRQQLKQTRESMKAAIQSNNSAQIQQLASTEGSEMGQLAAIHGTSMAKVYQILTPDQQQKLQSIEQARQAARQARHSVRHGAASEQAPTGGPQN